MSMGNAEHQHLTQDEKFPSGLDWSMDFEVREKERDPRSQLGVRDLEWQYKLDQSLRLINETFPELEPFHDSLDGHLNVGYSFDFKLGPEGEIAVMAKMHPALVGRHAQSIIYDEVMAEACLILRFKNRRTEKTVRDHLREEMGQLLEELPMWGKPQPEANGAAGVTDAGGALYIKLQDGRVDERVALSENAALDIDQDGRLLGISLQQVSALGPEHDATGGPAVFIRIRTERKHTQGDR
jgi:uncharacterized protein YuzE